jgi:hypothetical protein
MDSNSKIKVIVKLRPLLEDESKDVVLPYELDNYNNTISMQGRNNMIKEFGFDKIYDIGEANG